MSTVRSNQRRELGFLNDYRRMNVGMTRAKYSLIVVGNSTTLEANEIWCRFVNYCRDDANLSTHYISPPGRDVLLRDAIEKLFPEKFISTGPFWTSPRFKCS